MTSNVTSEVREGEPSPIALLLKEGKERTRKTSRRVASEVGVKENYISQLINDRVRDDGRFRRPSHRVLSALSMSLDLPLQELLRACGHTNPEAVRPVVVGICGLSGCGKTWFAKQLRQYHAGKVATVSLDSFYLPDREVERLEYRHDNPAAIDAFRAQAALVALRSRKSVDVPVYDFASHRQAAEKAIEPLPVIVIEGHLLFHFPELMGLIDLKVWIETSTDTARYRRVMRDTKPVPKGRGRSQDEVSRRWENDVLPSFTKFIYPKRSEADIAFVNDRPEPEHKIPTTAKVITSYIVQLPFYSPN